MSTQTMSPVVLRKAGLEAVAKALGPLGLVRFLQQFETGSGNYTKEREMAEGAERSRYYVGNKK